jgi:hypothetical protein
MMQKIEKRGTCLELLLGEEYVLAKSPLDLTINNNRSWPTGLNMFTFFNQSKKSILRCPQHTSMIILKPPLYSFDQKRFSRKRISNGHYNRSFLGCQ